MYSIHDQLQLKCQFQVKIIWTKFDLKFLLFGFIIIRRQKEITFLPVSSFVPMQCLHILRAPPTPSLKQLTQLLPSVSPVHSRRPPRKYLSCPWILKQCPCSFLRGKKVTMQAISLDVWYFITHQLIFVSFYWLFWITKPVFSKFLQFQTEESNHNFNKINSMSFGIVIRSLLFSTFSTFNCVSRYEN